MVLFHARPTCDEVIDVNRANPSFDETVDLNREDTSDSWQSVSEIAGLTDEDIVDTYQLGGDEENAHQIVHENTDVNIYNKTDEEELQGAYLSQSKYNSFFSSDESLHDGFVDAEGEIEEDICVEATNDDAYPALNKTNGKSEKVCATSESSKVDSKADGINDDPICMTDHVLTLTDVQLVEIKGHSEAATLRGNNLEISDNSAFTDTPGLTNIDEPFITNNGHIERNNMYKANKSSLKSMIKQLSKYKNNDNFVTGTPVRVKRKSAARKRKHTKYSQAAKRDKIFKAYQSHLKTRGKISTKSSQAKKHNKATTKPNTNVTKIPRVENNLRIFTEGENKNDALLAREIKEQVHKNNIADRKDTTSLTVLSPEQSTRKSRKQKNRKDICRAISVKTVKKRIPDKSYVVKRDKIWITEMLPKSESVTEFSKAIAQHKVDSTEVRIENKLIGNENCKDVARDNVDTAKLASEKPENDIITVNGKDAPRDDAYETEAQSLEITREQLIGNGVNTNKDDSKLSIPKCVKDTPSTIVTGKGLHHKSENEISQKIAVGGIKKVSIRPEPVAGTSQNTNNEYTSTAEKTSEQPVRNIMTKSEVLFNTEDSLNPEQFPLKLAKSADTRLSVVNEELKREISLTSAKTLETLGSRVAKTECLLDIFVHPAYPGEDPKPVKVRVPSHMIRDGSAKTFVKTLERNVMTADVKKFGPLRVPKRTSKQHLKKWSSLVKSEDTSKVRWRQKEGK
jgi:hypothetical protein